jgi:hypothetical protein
LERAVSRILYPKGAMIIYLGCRSPGTSCDLPGNSGGQPSGVSLFGLAPGGVYHAFHVTTEAVSSYLTFSPLPAATGVAGGLFSVALSLGLPPVRVTNHPALRSSDFPPALRPAIMHPLQASTICQQDYSVNVLSGRYPCWPADRPAHFPAAAHERSGRPGRS